MRDLIKSDSYIPFFGNVLSYLSLEEKHLFSAVVAQRGGQRHAALVYYWLMNTRVQEFDAFILGAQTSAITLQQLKEIVRGAPNDFALHLKLLLDMVAQVPGARMVLESKIDALFLADWNCFKDILLSEGIIHFRISSLIQRMAGFALYVSTDVLETVKEDWGKFRETAEKAELGLEGNNVLRELHCVLAKRLLITKEMTLETLVAPLLGASIMNANDSICYDFGFSIFARLVDFATPGEIVNIFDLLVTNILSNYRSQPAVDVLTTLFPRLAFLEKTQCLIGVIDAIERNGKNTKPLVRMLDNLYDGFSDAWKSEYDALLEEKGLKKKHRVEIPDPFVALMKGDDAPFEEAEKLLLSKEENHNDQEVSLLVDQLIKHVFYDRSSAAATHDELIIALIQKRSLGNRVSSLVSVVRHFLTMAEFGSFIHDELLFYQSKSIFYVRALNALSGATQPDAISEVATFSQAFARAKLGNPEQAPDNAEKMQSLLFSFAIYQPSLVSELLKQRLLPLHIRKFCRFLDTALTLASAAEKRKEVTSIVPASLFASTASQIPTPAAASLSQRL